MNTSLKISLGATAVMLVLAGMILFSKSKDDSTTAVLQPRDYASTTKLWTRNKLNGFSFETPEPVVREMVPKPAGFETAIRQFDTYIGKHDNLLTMFIFMDTNFAAYNVQAGLKGAIENSVLRMSGTDLKLQFQKGSTLSDEIFATGKFKFQAQEILVKGYLLRREGAIRILIALIPDTKMNETIINRIIKSCELES